MEDRVECEWLWSKMIDKVNDDYDKVKRMIMVKWWRRLDDEDDDDWKYNYAITSIKYIVQPKRRRREQLRVEDNGGVTPNDSN